MLDYKYEDYDCKTDKSYNDSDEIRSRNLPQVPGARPIVDPEAQGNVDPNLYPQPKEATHKIRGKTDFIEYLFGAVDQELLTVKTFYFFFYSAFGSLFPLMGVYFKQMGMNAGQCGLLIGLRPFIEFFSAPFWGSWADRWQKGKLILLASLSCWIIFTLPLGFIQPPATSCMIYKNHTSYLYVPNSDQRIIKRSATLAIQSLANENSIDLANLVNTKFKQLPFKMNGKIKVDYTKFYNGNLHRFIRHVLNDELHTNKTINKILPVLNKIDLEELIKDNRYIDIIEYNNFLTVSTSCF